MHELELAVMHHTNQQRDRARQPLRGAPARDRGAVRAGDVAQPIVGDVKPVGVLEHGPR